jgi:hypothetical protein
MPVSDDAGADGVAADRGASQLVAGGLHQEMTAAWRLSSRCCRRWSEAGDGRGRDYAAGGRV